MKLATVIGAVLGFSSSTSWPSVVCRITCGLARGGLIVAKVAPYAADLNGDRHRAIFVLGVTAKVTHQVFEHASQQNAVHGF